MKSQSTAIICAYNEEKTIVNILKSVCELNLFNEVIVINDGSNDKTGLFINELKESLTFTSIHLSKNMGKGYAMARGTEMANNEQLVFLDADLSNFASNHALKLLNPVLSGKADMVLGQATKTFIHPFINPFKKLSGQRALKKKDLIPILEKMKTAGYGVETLINMHFRANKKVIEYVFLHDLEHPTKFQKTKPHKAIKEFFVEGFQIIITMISNLNIAVKFDKNRIPDIFSINN